MVQRGISRIFWAIVGAVVTIIALAVAAYVFIDSGGVPMQTSAAPLPFERAAARMALHASYGGAADKKDPLTLSDDNMVRGAKLYRDHCAGCHGLPNQPSSIAKRMFPSPPQMLEPKEMVTNDPEGVTFWKMTNGIRLSGMASFKSALSDEQRWQIAMLLAHADKISPAVISALASSSDDGDAAHVSAGCCHR